MNLAICLGSPSDFELLGGSLLEVSSTLLESLQQCFSLGFVFSSSFLAKFLEGGCDFLVSFLFLLESFGFGWDFLLGLHYIHNLYIINIKLKY